MLSRFENGFSGAVSRSIDNVIVSMKNGSDGEIPFGAPVFQQAGQNACLPFAAATSTSEKFLGFAVREAVKTPEEYGSNEGVFRGDYLVEVLVRGSAVLTFAGTAAPGSPVYIRKEDGALVTAAGTEGTTLLLPNVTVRAPADSAHCAEVVVTKRNLM